MLIDDFKLKPAIAGVVVLYNSDNAVLSNIKSYINQVNRLYVIDNSEQPNPELTNQLVQISSVVYVGNGQNEGIATALNKAARMAIADKFDYLLTMDDDTSVPNNLVEEMLSFLAGHPDINTAIVAGQSNGTLLGTSFRRVPITITSGNLLSLRAYLDCGPFLDELFIDWVDHEYCMRLRKYGYEIVELDYVPVNHRLGTRKSINLLGWRVEWTSHSPLRWYYSSRNTLYVLSKYISILPAKQLIMLTEQFVKNVLKNILLEDQKGNRFKMLRRSITDSLLSRMGKYVE